MKVGASALMQMWGRPMEFWRDGTKLFDFKGRMAEGRPTDRPFDESFDQHNMIVIGDAADFGSVIPRKFDVVRYRGEDYTVQRGRTAGADEDELVKMEIIGGNT